MDTEPWISMTTEVNKASSIYLHPPPPQILAIYTIEQCPLQLGAEQAEVRKKKFLKRRTLTGDAMLALLESVPSGKKGRAV